jgi:hypothetical protein
MIITLLPPVEKFQYFLFIENLKASHKPEVLLDDFK